MIVQFVLQFLTTIVQIFLPHMNQVYNRDSPDPPLIWDLDQSWYESVKTGIMWKVFSYSLLPWIDLIVNLASQRVRQVIDSSCTVYICCRKNGKLKTKAKTIQ